MSYANLTREEARARAALLARVEYHVELDLTGEGETFPSRTEVRFDAEPGSSTFIDLQAHSVEQVTLNGRPLPADVVTTDRIRLPRLEPSNVLLVEASCRYERSGVGLHRFTDPVDGAVYLHTQFEPFDAHRVYACFDQPDLKAPFTLTVHAPEDWTVISNTEAVEEPSGGVWRFAESLPISTYITALVAGPFHSVHDVWTAAGGNQEVPLGLHCRRSLAQHLDAEEFLEVTKQGLDYFTEKFAYAYPFGSYDQLLVPEFNWGAMENPGCITFSEQFVFRSKVTEAARQSRASTILHEMAHMWFGDLVTMRWWDDLWLNESFATYMGTRALAEATRFTDAWASFSSSVKGWAIAQDQLPSTHPIAADIVDTESVRTHFDGITYAKGASVLKQLVAWVGDEAFFAGLQAYFTRHAYGNAALSDFLAALEEPSGRDLGPWSKQWLETAGVATVRPEVVLAPDQTMREVHLRQEAPTEHPHLRDHRIAVGAYSAEAGRLVRTARAELDLRGGRTEVTELAGLPQPDLLLGNDDDLAFVKLRLDDRSVSTLMDGLASLEDPLPRALCWGAAWDMTRDAELAASRFVTLVADHAQGETDVALLQGLLTRAQSTVDRYTAGRNRAAARARLAQGARATLDAAAPGSDAQLVWARAFASAAGDADELALIHALLDGKEAIHGLTVDTDLRWHLLGVLASHGAVDDEEARDATDMGARRAATARAARPHAEAKAKAWDAVLTDADLTLAMRQALLRGFWQYGQDALLAPYVPSYGESVQTVWAERNPEEALSLTGGLYPATILEQSVVAEADAALASPDLPAPAARIIAEQRDHTLRALRVRDADIH